MNPLLLAGTSTLALFFASLTGYVIYRWFTLRRLASAASSEVNERIGAIARSHSRELNMLVGQAHLYFTARYAALVLLPLLTWVILGGWVMPLLAGAVAHLLPRYLLLRRKKRRLRAIEDALPNSLMMVASSLRSGSALSVAIQTLVREQPGPLGEEFATTLREQKLGVDFDSAMQNMAERIDIPDFHLVIVALRVSREVGGNLAEILDSLASTIRNKAILEGKIKALTAQGTIQGIIMALLPFPIAGVLYLLEPEAMSQLFTTTLGNIVCFIALAMEAMGYWVIRKILTIDI